jgi:Uma2 family endonuclease
MTTELLEDVAAGRAPSLVPLTVEQFHEMIKAGIVPDGSPIELIEGFMVYKDRGAAGDKTMVHNPRHALIVSRLLRLLTAWCDGIGHHLRIQLPVSLSTTSAPEPDAAIIVGDPDAYADRHPGAGEISAVFEVADSSLRYDRTTKQLLYASAEVPTYWIINLAETQIEVHLRPDAARGRFSEQRDYRPGQSIPLAIGQHVLDVDVAAILA